MSASAWARLAALVPEARARASAESLACAWLSELLERNARCAYLREHRSPRDVHEFRARVPVVDHDDLAPWIDRVCAGESDVLFAGRPVVYERTGGSSGGTKLIPYSTEGLADFRRALLPWLAEGVQRFGVTGRAYLSISPATRAPERIGGIAVGFSDGDYLGEAASVLAEVSAVPLEVASIENVDEWRAATLAHLAAAHDLELVSVWSPTFLLRLLDDLPDPRAMWPRLKVVSCWASGASRPFAGELAARLTHAHLQPKGLVSTECVVTVPDERDRPVLTEHGFFEFERDGRLHLAGELDTGSVYAVVATSASGLYRYRTGDLVRCEGRTETDRPVLEFVGRGELASDLVGEKLTEPFVERCLADVAGFRFLAPRAEGDGYVLLAERGANADSERVEQRLRANPQYDHARRMGQLGALRVFEIERLFDRYAEVHLELGARLGDVKPVALRSERTWATRLARTT